MYPISPIFLFSDSQLLFWTDENGRGVLQDVRDGLEGEPKAAYIGASNGDDPAFFGIFEAAMDLIGIKDRRMIYKEYNEEDKAYLADAHLILLAGGDVSLGWKAISGTEMQQDIIQRYYAGAILCGVSAGAIQLGLGGFPETINFEEDDLYETFKLIPFYMDAHDEDQGWMRLKRVVSITDPNLKGVGIPKGGGVIYHPDHTVEPIRQSLVEFSGGEDEIHQNLLLPPVPGQEKAAE